MCRPAGSGWATCWGWTTRPDAGLLVRIADSRAAERSRVKLSLLDLPLLPDELVELVPEQLRPPARPATGADDASGQRERSVVRGRQGAGRRRGDGHRLRKASRCRTSWEERGVGGVAPRRGCARASTAGRAWWRRRRARRRRRAPRPPRGSPSGRGPARTRRPVGRARRARAAARSRGARSRGTRPARPAGSAPRRRSAGSTPAGVAQARCRPRRAHGGEQVGAGEPRRTRWWRTPRAGPTGSSGWAAGATAHSAGVTFRGAPPSSTDAV